MIQSVIAVSYLLEWIQQGPTEAIILIRLAPLDDLDPVGRHPVALLGPQGHDDPREEERRQHESGVVPQHAVGSHPHQEQDRYRRQENQLLGRVRPRRRETGGRAGQGRAEIGGKKIAP